MKTIKYIAMALLVGMMMLTGCAKHDFINDNTITGSVGPQSFWRVASSAVRAGSEMGFDVQYYTTAPGAKIDRVEIWYNVYQIEVTSVSSRHVPGFTATNNVRSAREVRISQMIHSIPHSPTLWSDSVGAYWMWDTFPVSNTLTPFSWEPETFNHQDSLQMKRLFGDDFMANFKTRLQGAMRFADYQRMLVTNLQLMELADFNVYRDSSQIVFTPQIDPETNLPIIDPETGLPKLDWTDPNNKLIHFPDDVIVDGVVRTTNPPAVIRELFNTVTFAQLVMRADGYNVTYSRDFQINAHLRIYDTRGVFSTTRTIQIDVMR